jgi:hypothetical protein
MGTSTTESYMEKPGTRTPGCSYQEPRRVGTRVQLPGAQACESLCLPTLLIFVDCH